MKVPEILTTVATDELAEQVAQQDMLAEDPEPAIAAEIIRKNIASGGK